MVLKVIVDFQAAEIDGTEKNKIKKKKDGSIESESIYKSPWFHNIHTS